MDDLEKTVGGVSAKQSIWPVPDATTGQDAVSQAELFNRAPGLTGIILTKLIPCDPS